MGMEIDVKDWRFKSDPEKGRNIVGTYVVKNGAIQIATQDFNGEYNSSKILFSTQLMVDIENISARIVQEITKNLLG